MKKTLLFLFALVTMATHAQTPGDIAQSYGAAPGFNNNVGATATQTDGKILVGGAFTTYNGATENRIIRLNTDGSKDTSFNTGTGFDNTVSRIKIQADGKIIVGGNFTTYNGVTENRIIRLDSDGTKDASFNTGTGFDNSINTIAQQADGKILVGGLFTTFNGVTENRIIRLNADGTKDATFTAGTGFNINVIRIAEQADGKILVGGQFTTYNGIAENRIIRLNSDGSKDTAFATGTGFGSNINEYVITIEQQSDGKILVGGRFFTYNNGVNENYILRLNTDGTKDATFYTGTTSTGFNGNVWTIAQQANGKNLVGGFFNYFRGVAENRIIRLNTDSTKDTSFITGIGFNANVWTLQQQPDGKILSGGGFTSFNGVTENRIIRLNSDGTKDNSFNTGTGFDNTVLAIKQQLDGKILIGGSFTSYNGVTENYIIRLNTDGTKDTSFNTGTGFNGNVWTIELQPDGKILIGGFFTSFNGSTQNRIIRLNTDGTKDTTFNVNTGFDGNVWKIKLQPNGKILAGGFFTSFNGVTENRIIRLNTDGTKDTTFNTGTGFDNSIRAIELQTDGKIIVGGLFTTYNGVTENRIITLNTDGTKNVVFNAGTGFNSEVYTINQQTDGKILVGGNFRTYKGDTSSAYLIKLHTEASISNTAVLTQIGNEGDEPNTVTSTVTTAQLGQILPSITDIVVANEAAYQAYIDANPALFASPATAAEVQAMVTAVNAALSTDNFEATTKLTVYPNPAQNVLHLQSNNFTTIKGVKIYDLQGKVVLQDTNDTINVSNLSKGLYIVKISTEEGEVTKKFIKE